MRVPFTHGLPIITADFASIRAGNFILQLYHATREQVCRGSAETFLRGRRWGACSVLQRGTANSLVMQLRNGDPRPKLLGDYIETRESFRGNLHNGYAYCGQPPTFWWHSPTISGHRSPTEEERDNVKSNKRWPRPRGRSYERAARIRRARSPFRGPRRATHQTHPG
jgi:hypothetical protein